MIITSKLPFFEKGETLYFTFLTCMTAEHGSKGGFSSHDARTTSVAVSLYIDVVGSVRKTWNRT